MKKKLEILSVISLFLISLVTPAYADAATGTVEASVFMHQGESQQVTFSGSTAPQWSSADPSVATVDVTGRVTGVSAGHTTVTAAFGSDCLAQCAVNVGYKGIDVSEHNGSINWTSVKNAGIDFAMIRTGYGGDPDAWTQQKDDEFESYYSGATAAGLKVGVYHYSYATNVTMASQEADFCISILNGRHIDYPVVYDVEDKSQWGLSTSTMKQIVDTFCSRMQQAGYKVAVYSYVTFYNNYLTSCTGYDTWIANTGGVAAPNFSYPYTMWQYAQDYVSGVSGACDLDYSYIDYSSSSSGSSGGSTSTMDPLTFSCDTSSYTFGSNSTYTYKITTPDTYPPTAVSSNPSAVTVSSAKATTNGFLFTMTNVGAGTATITTTAGDGRSVSFVATGTGTASASTLKCDTSSYTFGSNSVYSYKITTNASTPPTAVSSDSSVVSVAYAQKLSDGYLYQIKNVGSGTAVITTTAANGMSVSFPATASGAASASAKLVCDTSSYTFSAGSVYYYYKITTGLSSAPSASSSNSSAVSVTYAQKLSDGYLYRIKNESSGSAVITTTASDGSTVSFPAKGTAQVSTSVKSDTPFYFNMKKGSTYQFEFTGGSGAALSFTCGNGSVLKGVSTKKINGKYYYKVTAVGKGCAGIYAVSSGGAERVSIVTVA